jgi:hypothetical protein
MVSFPSETAAATRATVPATFGREQLSKNQPLSEEASDDSRRWRDRFRWLGTSGGNSVTNSRQRRAFVYAIAVAATIAGVLAVSDVITSLHDRPGSDLAAPILSAATGWVTFVLFFWIPWTVWIWTLPPSRPRWKLLIHIPGALGFSLGHVGGFVLLRRLAAGMAGSAVASGPFVTQFLYEAGKDGLTYLLLIACFTLVHRLEHGWARAATPDPRVTFDIRDGAKLIRVRIDDILAVASAGNYVEFTLGDGRRPLMRSSLSALESELAPLGFLRTHRSWLVNAKRVTALKPAGSGDYVVEVATISVPLSRRYSPALAKLKGLSA